MSQNLRSIQQSKLSELYTEMKPDNLYPLWEVLNDLVTVTPESPAKTTKWDYKTVQTFLLRSGDLISAEQAERRVLILENPGLPGSSGITPRLYAGLQLILPGEISPCHRHSQSALRFIMEGQGAYTSVDGEKAYMSPFDLILTPNGRWHDHGNETELPMIWLDGLDIPIVRHLDAGFAERYEAPIFPEKSAAGSTQMRYGRNMRPMVSSAVGEPSPKVPLFHYPYAEWSQALDAVAGSDAPDPYLGHALEFLNPANSGSVMSTISANVRLIPAGYETGIRRSTEGAIYTVVEGKGEVEVDGEVIKLEPLDIIVVPSWKAVRWRANQKLVLFCYSDRVVQEKLNLYKESFE